MSNDKDQEILALKFLAIPTVLVGLLIALIPLGILNAWVLQKLYGWFLLPLRLPHLNLWHIWGIYILIVELIPANSPNNGKDHFKKLPARIIGSVIGSFFALGLAYVLKGHIA